MSGVGGRGDTSQRACRRVQKVLEGREGHQVPVLIYGGLCETPEMDRTVFKSAVCDINLSNRNS